MKTNQLMIRNIGRYCVVQRTSDGFFDANSLIKSWNNNPENTKREINKFLTSSKTQEFISALKDKLAMSQKCDMLKIRVLDNVKGRATVKGRTADKVWMHPYLFTKLAMWINPTFEVDVVMFVYDQMIKYRNEAGDAYRELSSAVATIVPKNEMKAKMRKVGEAVNWVIFNAHEKMLRNKEGDERKQRELWMFEKKVATLINEGFIRNFDGLINYLRRQWQVNNNPPVFIR